LKPKFILGNDVRQVLTYVSTGNADDGIVYATDAMITQEVSVVATGNYRITSGAVAKLASSIARRRLGMRCPIYRPASSPWRRSAIKMLIGAHPDVRLLLLSCNKDEETGVQRCRVAHATSATFVLALHIDCVGIASPVRCGTPSIFAPG